MGSRIVERAAEGIYRLASGAYRVKVGVGDKARGGRSPEKQFPAGAHLKTMKAWRDEQRAALRREGLVPARGTLNADIPADLDRVRRRLDYPGSREDEINALVPQFGERARHTI